MVEILERIGRFTNSNIWKLTTKDRTGKGFGAPALTYIEEKRAERCLGRSVDLGKDSQSTVWGKVAEHYCNLFHLDLSYTLMSKETKVHPKYKFWSGSPDAQKTQTACEIKCFEPKKYFELSSALLSLKSKELSLDEFKKDFKEVYWQVVGNAILLNKPKAEIIAYMPTESQLKQIREELENDNYKSEYGKSILEYLGLPFRKVAFIWEYDFCNLPYVPDSVEYPNFVNYEFVVPADDIVFLTKCVIDAEKLLTNG